MVLVTKKCYLSNKYLLFNFYSRIVFNKMTPSFDLTIQKPQENIKFRQIRLPSPLRVIFPLKAGVSNAKLIAQKITGHSIRPVCKLEEQTLTLENVLKTYDNK